MRSAAGQAVDAWCQAESIGQLYVVISVRAPMLLAPLNSCKVSFLKGGGFQKTWLWGDVLSFVVLRRLVFRAGCGPEKSETPKRTGGLGIWKPPLNHQTREGDWPGRGDFFLFGETRGTLFRG